MKTVLALLLSIALTACAVAGEHAANAGPRAKSLADASPEPSADVTPPTARAGDPLFLIAAIYGGWPESREGKPTITVEMTPEGAGFVATVVQTGLLDDSVAQTQDVLRIIQDRGGKWFVTSAAQYRKCYRTGAFEWTAKACP